MSHTRFTRLAGLLLALSLAGSVTAHADDEPVAPPRRFLDGKSEGWFWYDDPKDKPPEAQPKPPALPAPKEPAKETKKPKKDEPFSVAWLKKWMPILLERAIDKPTKENVEAYLYAQRVAMDKAQVYAETSRQVVYSDPMLDESNRVPLSSFAKKQFLKDVDDRSEDAIRALAQVGGLFVFVDSRCHFCAQQVPQIEELSKKYGFIVKYISLDGKPVPGVPDWEPDNGHARLLRLKVTPTVVFAVPPDNYMILSQGLMARAQLTERLLVAGETKNLIPAELASRANPYHKGVLSKDDVEDGASDDPKVWVNKLKQMLEKHY